MNVALLKQLRDQLSESISFGRFICDSNSSSTWDKWSNLSHKRYVEEAANYSKPGSVAQKKAFFEDYYKKKALLAKENAAAAAAAALASTSSQKESPNLPNNELVSVVEIQIEAITDPSVTVTEASENIKIEPASLPDLGIADQEISTATTEVTEGSETEKPLLKVSYFPSPSFSQFSHLANCKY